MITINIEEVKKFAKKYQREIIVGSVGVIGMILLRKHYKANYVPLAVANKMIEDLFADTNGDFTNEDNSYNLFQIERKS